MLTSGDKEIRPCVCVCVSVVSLTGVQALGDRGRFDQVTSTQVAGDEMVEVSDQVLPSRGSHVWSLFLATLRRGTDAGSELQVAAAVKRHLLALQGSDVHSQQRGTEGSAAAGR